MSKFFTQHAQERAKERYGLDLTSRDMAHIYLACRDGKAVKISTLGGSPTFAVQFKEKTLFVVTDDKVEIIITFRPPDAISAAANKKWRKAMPKKPKTAKYGKSTDYKRRLLAAAQDGGAE